MASHETPKEMRVHRDTSNHLRLVQQEISPEEYAGLVRDNTDARQRHLEAVPDSVESRVSGILKKIGNLYLETLRGQQLDNHS